MEFFPRTTMDGLKSKGIPTFNECEHFLIKPHPRTMQTIVIELENGKYMTININPASDNVDVKVHGEHKFNGTDFGTIKAFYNMNGMYDKSL